MDSPNADDGSAKFEEYAEMERTERGRSFVDNVQISVFAYHFLQTVRFYISNISFYTSLNMYCLCLLKVKGIKYKTFH